MLSKRTLTKADQYARQNQILRLQKQEKNLHTSNGQDEASRMR